MTRQSKFRSRPGIAGHCSGLLADEVTEVLGIPVTTVPRTLLDLAAGSSKRQVERALNEAEVQRLWDPLSLADLVERYPGRRGTGVLRAALGDSTALSGITKNDFEERFAAVLEAHGLPKPRFNADLCVGDRQFNVDCAWDELRLVVELDGGAVHGTRQAFESDRERDRLLLVQGWRVVRVTWRQLRSDSEAVVADLRALLERRRPVGG